MGQWNLWLEIIIFGLISKWCILLFTWSSITVLYFGWIYFQAFKSQQSLTCLKQRINLFNKISWSLSFVCFKLNWTTFNLTIFNQTIKFGNCNIKNSLLIFESPKLFFKLISIKFDKKVFTNSFVQSNLGLQQIILNKPAI